MTAGAKGIVAYFDEIIRQAADLLGVTPEVIWKAVASIIIILVVLAIRILVLKAVARRTSDVRSRYSWRKSTAYIAFALTALILGRTWISGFGALSTYLGLLSAGIAIALKDPLVNLVGWLFILWRKPFTVGDRVQLGEFKGDVIDLRIFQFTLMEIGNWVDGDQSTGRVIRIPNGKIFTEMLANYSKGFRYIWNEIGVLVTFESDWKETKRILTEIANRHAEHLSGEAERKVREASQKFMIFYNKLTPTVYTSVKDSGVMLTIRYLCEPRNRRDTSQAIWEDILEQFALRSDIDFAYPTTRYYDNRTEGKEGKQQAPPINPTE